jgi:hypothetical protein
MTARDQRSIAPLKKWFEASVDPVSSHRSIITPPLAVVVQMERPDTIPLSSIFIVKDVDTPIGKFER